MCFKQNMFYILKQNLFVAIPNVKKSDCVLQTWTEVYHQNFGG